MKPIQLKIFVTVRSVSEEMSAKAQLGSYTGEISSALYENEVRWAYCVEDAKDCIRTWAPDLVITHYALPWFQSPPANTVIESKGNHFGVFTRRAMMQEILGTRVNLHGPDLLHICRSEERPYFSYMGSDNLSRYHINKFESLLHGEAYGEHLSKHTTYLRGYTGDNESEKWRYYIRLIDKIGIKNLPHTGA